MYWSAGCEIELVPSGVVTTMSTGPTACAGTSSRVSWAALLTVKHAAVGVTGHGDSVTLWGPTWTLVVVNWPPGIEGCARHDDRVPASGRTRGRRHARNGWGWHVRVGVRSARGACAANGGHSDVNAPSHAAGKILDGDLIVAHHAETRGGRCPRAYGADVGAASRRLRGRHASRVES